MKLIHSHQSIFLLNNVKNLIDAQGIETTIKNEFAQGAAGGIAAATDAWAELWVVNDEDYDRAIDIVKRSHSNIDGADWICAHCAEKNDPSFEVCWQCQREKSEGWGVKQPIDKTELKAPIQQRHAMVI